MSSSAAIHQLRASRSRVGSSSQARNMLYGWNPEPETELEPNPSAGPPLSDFTRGLPRRNRAPSKRRPPTSNLAGANKADPRERRPSLIEKLRSAAGRRPSASSFTVANGQEPRKRGPSFGAVAGRPPSVSSCEAINREATRKRGPSLVAKARELINRLPTDTNATPSFRRLPDQLSRYDESASENEKTRLSIEAVTPSYCLIQRWKQPIDWLKPSNYWKRTHPAMNFRLWRIIARDPGNHWKLQASAERNLEAATLLYEQNGGNSTEWWPEDLEEEILDSWSLSFGGNDPPRLQWALDG